MTTTIEVRIGELRECDRDAVLAFLRYLEKKNEKRAARRKQHSASYYVAFGQRLRAVRKTLRQTEADTADFFQVSPATYRKWEDGQKPGVSRCAFTTYAAAWNVNLNYQVQGRGPMFLSNPASPDMAPNVIPLRACRAGALA